MKNFKPSDLSSALLFIVVGIVLFVLPGATVTTLLRIIGLVLLVGGGLRFYGTFKNQDRAAADNAALAVNALMAFAGVVLIIAPGFAVSLVPVVAGILILCDGVPKLIDAVKQPAGSAKNTMLVMSGITVLCGLVLFFNPFGTVELLIRILGVILVYNGATTLWMDYQKNKQA